MLVRKQLGIAQRPLLISFPRVGSIDKSFVLKGGLRYGMSGTCRARSADKGAKIIGGDIPSMIDLLCRDAVLLDVGTP